MWVEIWDNAVVEGLKTMCQSVIMVQTMGAMGLHLVNGAVYEEPTSFAKAVMMTTKVRLARERE